MTTSDKSMASNSKSGWPDVERPAGRPRNEQVKRAILEAAYDILVEGGLGRFSIDAVAVRSGTARTTIYRWWPTKGLLAIESFLQAFRPQLLYKETENVAADYRALALSLVQALAGPAGRIAASVVAEAQRDPETLRLFVESFSEPLRQESGRLLTRGITKGIFLADLDVERILDATVGAIYLRLLLQQPLDGEWSNSLCETLLKGCLLRLS